MISVVVTVYNEMAILPDLLVDLRALSREAQVIVVDGSSDDGSYELLEELRSSGERWFSLVRTPRCRGVAFNEGARLARGDALLFLHADCKLPNDALQQVRGVLAQRRAGCFGMRFDAPGAFMRWNGFASTMRARMAGIMFGDQAMFVQRELFWEMGGFPEIPLMEDYEFSLRLKARGERVGVAPGKVLASPRRYGRAGCGRMQTAAHMLALRARYRLGQAPSELAREYEAVR